jgi:hypothetical protein
MAPGPSLDPKPSLSYSASGHVDAMRGPDQPDAILQHAPSQPGCYDVHLGTEARGGQ